MWAAWRRAAGASMCPAALAVLPREQLDDILRLRRAARGCRSWLAPARFEAPLAKTATAGWSGARLKLEDGSLHEVRAQWVVLATGAVPAALIAAGVCERRTPSGIALRGYIRNPAMTGRITCARSDCGTSS